VIVRRAIAADVPAVLALIKALAAYEREPDAVKATEESLMRSLFADNAQVFAHVAEVDGAVVGIAVWFLNYSTWTGKPGVYLEDLFVADTARGSGAGKALFKALAEEAERLGCARIDWAVLDWNTPAMDFYRALGGRAQSGWQPWRIDGPALEALRR
jgi:GNAT superfamily N-acetyltransferase